MNLHFPSALVGGAFCSLLFLTVGAQKAQLKPLEFEKSLRIEGIATPDELWSYTFQPQIAVDLLELEEHLVYFVPYDKRLVVTDHLLSHGPQVGLYEDLDGTMTLKLTESVPALRVGVSFAPGSNVVMFNADPLNNHAFDFVKLYGYLVDA